MIFLTVGTQLSFDRLADALDAWASEHPEHEVFGQVGPTDLTFATMRADPFLTPSEFERRFASARLVIAHAGMGTILAAADARKPLIVMPRKASLGEHRNDHQLATARRLESRIGLLVAWDAELLGSMIERAFALGVAAAPRVSSYAEPRLIGFVRAVIRRTPAAVSQEAMSPHRSTH